MKELKNVFTAINQKRKSVVATFTAIIMMALVTGASAAPTADTETVTAVTDGMTSIQMTALAVVAAVAGVAVLLFAAPFAWQYGKKIFKTVAR